MNAMKAATCSVILALFLVLAEWGICQQMSNEELNYHIQAGWKCYHQQNYQDTIQHWEKILPLLQQNYETTGDQEVGFVFAKLNTGLGIIYQNFASLQKSLHHYQISLSMYEKLYSKENPHPDTAIILNNIASVYSTLGNYSEAMKFFQFGLDMNYQIYGKNKPHPYVAVSLNNIGGVYSRVGKHHEAIQYYQASLDMYIQLYGKDAPHWSIATSWNNIGSVYKDLQNSSEAMKLLQSALDMMVQLHGKNKPHPDIANCLNNIASVYDQLGNYPEAMKYGQAALDMRYELYGKNTPHPDIANSFDFLCNIYKNLGNYPEAMKYYQASLEMYTQLYGQNAPHQNIASSLSNMGLLCISTGNYKQALQYFQNSLNMSYQLYGQDTPHQNIAASLNNIGSVHQCLKNYPKALQYFKASLDMRYRLYGNQPNPDISNSLNNMGVVYYNLEKYSEALKYYQAALNMSYAVYGQAKSHPYVVAYLNNIAIAHIFNKNYSEAWKKLGTLKNMSQPLFESYTSAGADNDMRTIWEQYLGPVNHGVLTLLCLDSDKKYVSYAYKITLSNKSAVRRLLMANRQILSEIQDPKILRLYQEYQTHRQQEANFAFAWSDDPTKAQYIQTQRQELAQKCKELETVLNQKCAAFRTVRQYPKIDLPKIQRQINSETVLLEFLVFYHLVEKKDWLGCFVVKAKSVVFVSLGPTEKIQPAVEDLLNAIRDDMKQLPKEWKKSPLVGQDYLKTQEPRIQAKAWEVAKLIYEPLALHCEHARQLVIAPDGFLHLLPLGILAQKQGNDFEYLVNRYNFVYCFGGDSFTKISATLPPNLAFYGIDNPDFDLSPEDKQQSMFTRNSIENNVGTDSPDNAVLPGNSLDKSNRAAPNNAANQGNTSIPNNAATQGNAAPDQGNAFPAPSNASHAGNPSQPPKLHFRNLNQWEEMRHAKSTVKANFPKARMAIDSGQDALKSLVKIQLPRAHWVHVVSHGFFLESKKESQDQRHEMMLADTMQTLETRSSFADAQRSSADSQPFENPLLLSGIVLAGANHPAEEGREDGYLTAQEIALLKLTNIRCMILSCCGTGLGKSEQAAGFSGLKWSLEYAGVQHSILTLWDISNLSSPILDEFYNATMEDEIAIPAALNMIQRCKATSRTYESHPGIWAAFICNGIPQK